MPTYHYVAASRRFLLEEEPLHEVIEERIRNYHEQEKEVDFWLIEQPAFLQDPELAEVRDRIPQPAAAVVSTDPQFITWLKLRLEYVASGQFEAPSEAIPEPLASLATA
ncbi:MAG: MgPME-cyclase complex family protein [Cyanobacteria bacterium P01_A01_bin.135]